MQRNSPEKEGLALLDTKTYSKIIAKRIVGVFMQG